MMNKINPIAAASGHGRLERGLDSAPRSRQFQGRFGRLFRSLPPADFDDDALLSLAHEMISPAEVDGDGKPTVTPETQIDDEENFGLPAGYTYFGQFVDHDITFDPLSSLVRLNDPDGLTDFRTPALDLDSLYGRGPDDAPYMYDSTGRKFLLGDRSLTGATSDGGPIVPLTPDLPRFHGRAIIGDKRNDENIIVSQLQGVFLRFHNFLADSNPDLSFLEVQRLVRWHYQWLILFDYLPRVIGRQRVADILPHILSEDSIFDDPPQLHFFCPRNNPFMPIEFSGAAYRFGHSMVRPVYRLSFADLPVSVEIANLGGRKPVFAPHPDDGLNGFQEFGAENGIDWRLFFDTPDHHLTPLTLNKSRVQPAYKIDTSLVNPLGFLPEFSTSGANDPSGAPNTNNLAFRNLKRGVMLQLPSGQAVARFMGLTPLSDDRLRVGKANADGFRDNKSIVEIDPRFEGKAPLWFYILAEAFDHWQQLAATEPTDDRKNSRHTLLGPVGGRIVGEVLIGLMLHDNDSFLAMEPDWKPLFGDEDAVEIFDRFTVGNLIQALPPV